MNDPLNVSGRKLNLAPLPQANCSGTLADPSPKLDLRQSCHFAESGSFFHLFLLRSFPRHADDGVSQTKNNSQVEAFYFGGNCRRESHAISVRQKRWVVTTGNLRGRDLAEMGFHEGADFL